MSDTSFTADLIPPLPPKPPVAPPKKPSKFVLIVFLLMASHVIVLLVAGGIGFGIGCAVTDGGGAFKPSSQYDSLAVLPFTGEWQPAAAGDNWPERRREYLEVILPDALSGQIAAKTTGSLKVMATHEIRGRHHPQQPPRDAGRDLNVRAVLSGQVSRDGRLTLQLISVGSGELLWSKTYAFVKMEGDAPRWHLPNPVEAEISQAIADRLIGEGRGKR